MTNTSRTGMADGSALEQQVRAMLGRQAGNAPGGDSMLIRVRHVAGRRARRRRITAAGVLAFVVLAGAGSAVAFGPLPVSRDRAQLAVSSTPVALVPGLDRITVPFTMPTPEGYADPAATISAGRPVLTFVPLAQYAQFGVITAELVADTPEITAALRAARPVERDGWWSAGGDEVQRMWWLRFDDAQWLRVISPLRYTENLLSLSASALTRAPIQLPAPMRFDVVPAGFTIDNLSSTGATLCPQGVAAGTATAGKLVVRWTKPFLIRDPAGKLTIVDGPVTTDGLTTVALVDADGSAKLTVQIPTDVGLTREDLAHFALGVHP